ncbi:MAG: glucose-1-phosphate cytidylyltransferase [Rhodospirillales bacterium]|nr:glucose-1-phosphate cytidylyltransferase [Rhodospirillales bacterium]
MKVVILAGGMGSRLSEETSVRPKPLVEVGGRPILWHIMKVYSHYGYNDFIICLGYKGYMIKDYFAGYRIHNSDISVELGNDNIQYINNHSEPWRVTLIDTGEDSGTGGRLKKVIPLVADDPEFFMTYGDGIADININALYDFHKSHKTLATVSAVRPIPRFGIMHLDNERVSAFEEKPHSDQDWVSGGFFVLSPKVGDMIDGDSTYWEQEPIRALVDDKQLNAYRHDGFWRPMDTLSDKKLLESMWNSGNPPWKVW